MSTEPERDVSTGSPLRPETEPPVLETERVPRLAPERALRPGAVRMAWTIAIITDAIQWVLWPFFAAGAASPFDDVVDVVVAVILIRLLGWHWSFLPTFVAELIPGANLVPTWTAAVFFATRQRRSPPAR